MELGGIQFLPTATSRSVQYHQSVAETDLSFACTEEPPTEITIILPFLQSKIMSWGEKVRNAPKAFKYELHCEPMYKFD